MTNEELMHYGVLGMKWGVRRSRPSSGASKTGLKKGKTNDSDDPKKTAKAESKPKKRTVKDLSDDELRQRIARLDLEKRYKDLAKSQVQPDSEGKKFVKEVLTNSGKNIATQLTTYVMGTAVNKMFKDVFNDESIINPKKGQKDK